ncbi:hypothetical protein [Streptomyces wedmorensis]|uniref:hypothetical protein n=1 Tax=Streptomyces wedmorensis TaxID=43759 RepID=UPI0037A9BB88
MTPFQNNLLVPTSSHSRTRTLHNALDKIRSDRVLISVDYPYGSMAEAAVIHTL